MKRFTAVFLTICLGVFSSAGAQEKAPAKTQTRSERVSKSFQFGIELRQYKYEEPGFVEHNGLLYGFWGEWLWRSAMGSGRTNADILFGTLKYDGALCDISNNCTPYTANTKDIIAKGSIRLEFPLATSTNLITGIGGRYLYDKGEGIGFYQRTGTWLFLPAGVNFNLETSVGKLIFEAEYDYIFYGNFRSNLSEVGSSFTDLTHTQTGYGLYLSTGLQFNDFSISGFYELWDLNESNTVESNGLFFIEPKNDSKAFGVKAGFRF